MTSKTNTKDEIEALVAEFNAVREELIEAASSVAPELREVAFVGSWDLKDVIAHTVGWDYTNVEALPDFQAGRLPRFFDRYDADWAAINADLVSRFRVEIWDELIESVRQSQRAFGQAMLDLPDADLDRAATWGDRRITLRGMMRAISKDESEHVRQIHAFVGERRR